MDGAAIAMLRLNIDFSVLFVSDTHKKCHKLLERHEPKHIYTDIMDVPINDKPYVDVYVFTPPCQDFSANGKQSGADGPRQTGELMGKALRYTREKKPRLVLFENAFALTHVKFRPVFRGLIKHILESGYAVYDKVINANTCGFPQDRRRLIIVAIRNDSIKCKFQWPEARKAVSLKTIMDSKTQQDVPGRLPKNAMGKKRCAKAYSECHQNGIDPRTTPVAVDIDAGEKFQVYGVDECKTITRVRGGCGGPWISTHGRRFTTRELLKAQGFAPTDVPYEELKITPRQVGMMVGNSLSPNMAGCVLQEALWSAGLTKEKPQFPIMSHCA
ncbi:unnamed protein product [Prorocentrum cordatum]|uniref:DNA (cytosine-5-)-methyltransferase n=1 Tax=Prorocentrum cordatum TaxID=2364126 RepID=A0ABN9UZU4_9DINO|nr:unnamed protein product [Polarella glacialis]